MVYGEGGQHENYHRPDDRGNVSGGGCPDVPYLAGLLVGQNVAKAEAPRLHGQTLCSYALQRAFEEARRLWHG